MSNSKIVSKYSNNIVIDESTQYREMSDVILGATFTLFSVFILSIVALGYLIEDVKTSTYLFTIFIKIPFSLLGFFQEDLEVFYEELNVYKLVLAIIFSTGSAFFIGKHFYKPRQNFKIKKGKTLIDDETAKKKLKAELQAQIDRTPNEKPQIRLVDDIYIADSRLKQHTMIVGGTGAGKGVLQMPIYKQIFDKDFKAVIFDFKGDMDKFFWKKNSKRGIFGIGDSRSWVWDIGTELYNESMADGFALYIITASKNADNQMWSNSAREVLKGIVYFLISEKKENKIHFGAREILALASRDLDMIQPIVLKYNPAVQKILAEANVTSLGVLLNMDAFLGPLKVLAKMEMDLGTKNLFTFNEWMFSPNPKYRQLIWTFDEEIPDYKPLYTLFFNFIVAKLSSKKYGDNKDKPLFLCFDELAQLQRINFKKVIEIGRSKNIRFICGYQDNSQMKDIYGQEDLDLMMSSMQTQIYGTFNQGATAKYLSETLGTQLISVANISNNQDTQSKNLSFSEKEKPLVASSYFSEKLGEKQIDGATYYRFLVVMPNSIYNIPFPLKAITDIKKENDVDVAVVYKSNYDNITTQDVYNFTTTLSKYPFIVELLKAKDKPINEEEKTNTDKAELKKLEKSQQDLQNAIQQMNKDQKSNFYMQLKLKEESYFNNTEDELETLIYDEVGLSFHFLDICFSIIDELGKKKELSQHI